MHHRMRTVSFAMVFVATSVHIMGRQYSLAAWLFLAALLLIYPHLQYWRALRAENSIEAEMGSLLADSVLLGMFVATVEFSDWLTFSVMLGTLSNNGINKGWRGIRETLLALLVGALIGIAVGGFKFSPHTDWPATLLCIVGLGGYLLAVNAIGFSRNLQLRLTREQLESRERELLGANATLQTKLREIAELQTLLSEQASHDPLTGLYNRRYLDATLEREVARCKREGQPLSLLMIDIDHFKKYNDRYGHQAGDETLKCVARALQRSAKRASDLPARYGGEEFALVLADTDAAAARQLAEALRRDVEALAIAHEQSSCGQVTISIGLAATAGDSCRDVASLLRAADDALYHAKWGGRNRVQAAPPAPLHRRSLDADAAAACAPLVWHGAYESGHAALDDQHRMLVRQVNGLLAATLPGRPTDDIVMLINELMRNLVQHFEDEEALIEAAGYPGATKHAASHRELMNQAVYLVGCFHGKELELGELLRFLAQDLVALHIGEADRGFFRYLKHRSETVID